MNAERARAHLLTLPHVVEWTQWGDLIYSVGDKAIGGKMFVMLHTPDPARRDEAVIAFAAGREHYHRLLEIEGISPAPYFARIHWVSVDRWEALTQQEWHHELSASQALTYARLAPKVKKHFDLPKTQQNKAILEARKRAAEKKAAKKS